MGVYYFIFLIISLCSFVGCFKLNVEAKQLLRYELIMLLSCFAGLRYGDQDYNNYVAIFKGAVASADVGFTFLASIIHIFTNNEAVFFLVVASLSVGLNFTAYRKMTTFYFTAILFYYVHFFLLKEMIQIRAGLSCAICLCSILYLDKNEYKKFFLTVALAISIHLTAIVFLPVFLIKRIKVTRKLVVILLSISFIVGIVYPLGQVIKALPMVAGLERIQTYSGWEQYNNTLGVLNIVAIKQILVLIYCLIFFDTFKAKLKAFEVLLGIYLISTCWLLVWNDFAILAARVATFFAVSEPILIASTLLVLKPSSRILVNIIMVVVALLILYLNLASGKVLPYRSILI
ncbi:MAG: EpsG family protein [Bacteroidales bacterium]